MTEEVILVDEFDTSIGSMEKMEAHEKGVLHRAFSVFIFNSKKQLLIQQRALTKYHSPGLWTNTCCSHPRPGEDTLMAANRRLHEEMGMDAQLSFKTHFIYKTTFKNGLTEHEFDHIFIGTSNEDPKINKEEVNGYKWINLERVKEEMKLQPETYTYWFQLAMEKFF